MWSQSSKKDQASSSPKFGQLAGRPALVDSRAKTEVEALLISPERLRGVIIAEAELGACARSSCAGSR